MPKLKEKSLKEIEETAKQALEEKKEIEKTFKVYDSDKHEIVTATDMIILGLTALVMALGAMERNKIVMFIGGIAFLVIILKITFGYIKN